MAFAVTFTDEDPPKVPAYAFSAPTIVTKELQIKRKTKAYLDFRLSRMLGSKRFRIVMISDNPPTPTK